MLELDSQKFIREIISLKFCQSRLENPRVSLRSFALRLGVSSGVLSDVINNKRPITEKTAKRFQANLNLSSEEKATFTSILKGKKIDFEVISTDTYELISDSIHFSLLRTLELEDSVPSIDWLSAKLGRTKRDISSALNKLSASGLITRSGGRWFPTKKTIHSTDQIPSEAIKSSHKQSLVEAKNSLVSDPVERRDFTSLTITVDQNKLDEYRDAIRDFRKKVLLISKNQNKKEVYKLSIQLFPITVSAKEEIKNV